MEFQRPSRLEKGDKVAIISPATIVKQEYVDGACEHLKRRGYVPVVMPHANGAADGSYAAKFEDRIDDLLSAWSDPEIKGILCARGGYGSQHMLPCLPPELFRKNAKWLWGFSDISALHAFLLSVGIQSVHASMARHLTEFPDDDPNTLQLFNLLEGGVMDYEFATHSYNNFGDTEGRLIGGNLAVLTNLAATPYDMFAISESEDVILFLEDISEAIYATERMLWRLYMAGTLSKVKGLVIGRFTDYKPDRNFRSMEDMIHSLAERIGLHDIPIAYDIPIGHIDTNTPMVEGARVSFSVDSQRVRIGEIR